MAGKLILVFLCHSVYHCLSLDRQRLERGSLWYGNLFINEQCQRVCVCLCGCVCVHDFTPFRTVRSS